MDPQMVDDELLRMALVEYMRFGPESRTPVAERIRSRAPDASEDDVATALRTVSAAVHAASRLATAGMRGERSERSIREELARTFRWLRPSEDSHDRRWWKRFLPVFRRDDLAQRLKNFGFYLMK
ncbi:MAG TPA: hypothetical protein VJ867_10580 [Gemmatimonadaceae bacterium]|nr:hypothetical protein [Gemmatimonadaceae bacterium]